MNMTDRSFSAFVPIKAYAWKGNTHTDIADKGIDLLRKDGYAEEFVYFDKYRSVIVNYSAVPDQKGDMDKGKGYHYYCAKNIKGKKVPLSKSGYYKSGNNFMARASYSRTARSIFEDNYQLALTFFARNNEESVLKAMEFVGRCVHMISDVCCTPHTTDLTLTSKYSGRHKLFEYRAREIYQDFTAENGDESIYCSHMRQKNVGEVMNGLAAASAEYYGKLMNTKDPDELDGAIGQLLILAQKNTAAFLLRLYKDISQGEIALVSDRVYRLKNVAAQKYLRTNKGSAAGYCLSKNRSENTLFRLTADNDGYYVLTACAADNKDQSLCLMKKCSENEQYGFKIGRAAVGYRLLTSASKFKNAVAASPNGRIYSKLYDPDDPMQHWIFEKA